MSFGPNDPGLSAGVATVSPFGGAAASTPVVWLDSFYDSLTYPSKTAAIQAAYNTAITDRATLASRASRVYQLDAGPLQLAPNAPLIFEGEGATLQASWGNPRCISFVRTPDSDYQTFRDIDLRDLICDANGLTAGANESIIGNIIDGGNNTRVNFARIAIRRVKTLNVPVGGSGGASYLSLALTSAHLASNEATQTTILDVLVEDCDFTHGGNTGMTAGGTGVATAGLGVNVFLDRITVSRTRADSTVVPTGFVPAANFQIGGIGFGNRATLRDCVGANSGDVAYEIDGMQDVLLDNCEGIDAWTAKFLCRNFRPPPALESQKNTLRHCTGRNVNLDRVSGGAPTTDFYNNGDASTAGYVFGETVLDDCRSASQTPMASPAGSVLDFGNAQFKKLTVTKYTVGMSGLAVTGNGLQPTLINIRALNAGAVYDIGPITVKLAGTRSNIVSLNNWRIVSIEGAPDFRLNFAGLHFDAANFTGVTTASDAFYWLTFGVFHACTGRINVEDVRAVTTPAGGSHNAIWQGGLLSLTGKMRIKKCDLANLPAGNGTDYTIQTALKPNTVIGELLTSRAQGSGGPLQTRTSITPGASPYAYQNLDSIMQDVFVIGGTVSLIEYSIDGVTYDSVGQVAGRFRVDPGCFLRVTYTAAPTMNKSPTP